MIDRYDFHNLKDYVILKSEILSCNIETDSIIASAVSNDKKTILIVKDQYLADLIYEYLKYIVGDCGVVFIPEWDILPYDIISPSKLVVSQRMNALYRLYNKEYQIVILTPSSLIKKIIPLNQMKDMVCKIKRGGKIDKEEFVYRLVHLGYERVTYVEQDGDLAVRGMVIDLFPVSFDSPVRILFSEDIIEDMYFIDIKTQLRKERLNKDVLILPACEIPLSDTSHKKERCLVSLLDEVDYELVIFYDGIRDDLQKRYEDIYRLYKLRGDSPSPPEKLFDLEAGKKIEDSKSLRIIRGNGIFKAVKNYNSDEMNILSDIDEIINEDGKVIISSDNELYFKKMIEVINPSKEYKEKIRFELAPFKKGFHDVINNILWITQDNFFGIDTHPKIKEFGRAEPIEYDRKIDFTPNDYVVHINYGIGLYRGIEKLRVLGREREYAKIEYDAGDILYVPLYQLGLIHKYRNLQDIAPQLSKLHTSQWKKKREKAVKNAKEFAKQLIRLYALRSSLAGIKFRADSISQIEFESGFHFIETEDQKKAICEVKNDMEKGLPMDRLICGDSGYGKTEVALRAVFKAVNNNYQVVLLAPTTLLSHQHYITFTDRFRPFPYRIELLSRFQKIKKRREIVEGLREGEVDIIIGTHSLLSKNIQFKNLGLIIIDEEQRFGVRQKERLKTLRRTADVLTMTATPIPRTLQMALSSIKELSVIATPPGGRLPIQITVSKYNDNLIQEFIRRELNRDGQVFYIHNRVKSIYRVFDKIREWFPDKRVGCAHGKMKETELEERFVKFYHREYDILVCTTIIENGIDIPNANTIIVDDADRFGLAQLYQLRGRVGRSYYQAYAYFNYRDVKSLTDDARKRLETIKEFGRLSGGFDLAIRDLEIRGAGELLGKKQAGNVADVGFEIYSSLINRAVRLLKGEELVEERVATCDFNFEYEIPDDYVKNNKIRLQMYKKLSEVKNIDELNRIKHDIEDRFGNPPKKLSNLFLVIEVKILCEKVGLVYISDKNNDLILYLEYRDETKINKIQGMAKDKEIRIDRGRNRIYIKKFLSEEENKEKNLELIKKFLQSLE
ncbi:MAG: transcription-repair coupling factor [Candidatus Hydrogenedentota bacterium]